MFDFILLAIIGGIGLSLSLAILGNIIIWKKISYLSDSISHSSILGVALSLFTPFVPDFTIIIVCFIFSIIFVYLSNKKYFSKDVLLVLNTQSALALGILIVSIFGSSNLINRYFFGSLLSLNISDIFLIYSLSLLSIVYLIFNWQKILLNILSPDIAISEGINTFLQDVLLMFLLSCIITFSIKFAGILLIPAITILPALIVSNFTKTPFQSFIFSFFIAIFTITFGIISSIFIDLPTGPIITLYLIIIFILTIFINKLFKI